MNHNDYYTNGYTTEALPLLADALDPLITGATWEAIESGGWLASEENNPVLYDRLHAVFHRVCSQQLAPVFCAVDLVRIYVMKGYDAGSVVWHNDRIEGHNATLVLHMRDLTEETGGSFEMQNTGTGETFTIVPKRGSAILFSHQATFNRRVVPLTGASERIAIFFDCTAY